jgi:hypothetical protein
MLLGSPKTRVLQLPLSRFLNVFWGGRDGESVFPGIKTKNRGDSRLDLSQTSIHE